jgi:membrane associated rhomboid family serine protease
MHTEPIHCPGCGVEMEPQYGYGGLVHRCRNCTTSFVSAAQLNKFTGDAQVYRKLHDLAETDLEREGCSCPTCDHKMLRVRAVKSPTGDALEFCPVCSMAWGRFSLDRKNLEPDPAFDPNLTQEQRERIAAAHLSALKEEKKEKERLETGGSVLGSGLPMWKQALLFIGLPVETEDDEATSFPYAVWTLVLLCVGVYLISMVDLPNTVRQIGFIPAEWSRMAGLTLITSFLMHGGLWHLISNMYFLAVFGNDIEDVVGTVKFMLLVIGAHLAGVLLHWISDGSPTVPLVGASAGITGVMAYYLRLFPERRFSVRILFVYMVSMPVWVLMAIWLFVQVITAAQQTQGISEVSGLGHLGGFVFGLIWAFLASERDRKLLGER